MRHIRLCLRVKDSPHLRAAIAILALTACSDKSTDTGTRSTGAGTEDEAPSFATVRDEILVPSCGFSSCHGSGEAGLQIDNDMTADALVGVSSTQNPGKDLVLAGDPSQSYLIAKMEEDIFSTGDVMPPSGALSEERISTVRDWIAAGASD